MTGILEAIHADLQLIKSMLQNGVQQQAPAPQYMTQQQPGPTAFAQPQPQQPQYANAALAQPAPVPANLTADQITALIQPHIGNEAIKAELGNAMRAMGINALPETQPHQYGELYQRFQGVIQRFTGGGMTAAGAPATPQPASII